jgi:xanthine dehydrogenase accessory factor
MSAKSERRPSVVVRAAPSRVVVPDGEETQSGTLSGLPGLPVPGPGDVSVVLAAAAAAVARGVSGAMATVLERHGSAPGTPGQKLFLAADGTCVGTVGGGAVEREVLEALVLLLPAARRLARGVASPPVGDHEARRGSGHEVRTFKLGPELGMCCGGQLRIVIEPLVAVVPSLIVGAGHVASAVAPVLSRLGFAVTVVDERDAWTEEGRIPNVRFVQGEFDDLDEKDADTRGVCLVMTHDHALDQRAIEWALERGFAFVGGIGSRAKAERTRQRLEAKGFSEADRARVRMPLGVTIGARTPDEIAISVAAELIAWRTARA